MCELAPTAEDGHFRAQLRFYLLVVVGGVSALLGVVANALLAQLFICRVNYRHSPFFFMGFVAFFDTLVDIMYLFVMTLPLSSQHFHWPHIYLFWLQHADLLMLLVQIFKLSSVFCLVVASYERYFLTKHWTTSGFDYRTRWVVLFCVVALGVFMKLLNPTTFIVVHRVECETLFSRLVVERLAASNRLKSLMEVLTVAIPFFTLIFLNGGIVFMIRKQNVQQLRFLITELTMGRDLTEFRRQNLRSATNTLLFIISTYLIANTLGTIMTIAEYLYPVIGNALRCPAHLVVNAEVRSNMYELICGRRPLKMPKLKGLESIHHGQWENPWFSALLTTARDPCGERHGENGGLDSEPFLRRRSTQSLNPIFDREAFRRLSNVNIV